MLGHKKEATRSNLMVGSVRYASQWIDEGNYFQAAAWFGLGLGEALTLGALTAEAVALRQSARVVRLNL